MFCMGLRLPFVTGQFFLKLHAAVLRAVWLSARRQPLAGAGAVLGMLDGPQGVILLFGLVQVHVFRRYLAYRPTEVGGVYRHLEEVQRGCPGHGPLHALVASAARIGFEWPGLSNLVCLIQHFTSAIL